MRSAQQNYQQQVQNNSATFRRNAAYQDQLRYHRRHRPAGPVRRLFGLVSSLVFIAIAAGIFLLILSAAEPGFFDHVKTWLGQAS
jgi:hypothetical protein